MLVQLTEKYIFQSSRHATFIESYIHIDYRFTKLYQIGLQKKCVSWHVNYQLAGISTFRSLNGFKLFLSERRPCQAMLIRTDDVAKQHTKKQKPLRFIPRNHLP